MAPMRDRRMRIGENEALFRQVNERIEGLNESFATVTGTFEIVCECADARCVNRIPIARDAYERVRADPTLFIVAPGHESPEVEEVVDQQIAYHVVRKQRGLPQQVAKRTDPRG
jgi:hypothetical protein